MNEPFPFGYPLPTAFYLTFYVVTLVLNWIFMHYVLAGSAYVLSRRCVTRERLAGGPLDAKLREWMPLMLSGAITAGIAPLLFLQVLYQYEFYSANLLLFNRWMAVLPILIVGFYLLYLLKTDRLFAWPVLVRIAIAFAAFCCFLFIAWSWTENHLLSLDQENWVSQYASGDLIYHSGELLPRLALWFVLAFPTMATLVAWQLWYHNDSNETPDPRQRSAIKIALGGLLLAGVAAGVFYAMLSSDRRGFITSTIALPYLIAAAVGYLTQLVCWGMQWRGTCLQGKLLALSSISGVVMLLGIAVAREALRLGELDVAALYARHRAAYEVGGFGIFLAFFTINLALIVVSFWLVKRGLQPPENETSS